MCRPPSRPRRRPRIADRPSRSGRSPSIPTTSSCVAGRTTRRSAAGARRPGSPARARRRPRVAAGSDRSGLEGRVRHRHFAGRGGQRAAAASGRRPASRRPTSRPSTGAAIGLSHRSRSANVSRLPRRRRRARLKGRSCRPPSAGSSCRGVPRRSAGSLRRSSLPTHTSSNAATRRWPFRGLVRRAAFRLSRVGRHASAGWWHDSVGRLRARWMPYLREAARQAGSVA